MEVKNKMPSAYSIPQIYEDEIEGAIEAGYYSNRSEVVRDALRHLFESKQNLRMASAIELYKKEKVTLSRAAELAGVTSIEFKEVLADRGVAILIPKKSQRETKSQTRLLKKIRSAK